MPNLGIFGKSKGAITNATHPAPAKVPRRKPAGDFKVPSPADVVPDLAKLDRRTNEINASMKLDRAEIRVLEDEISRDDTKELHPAVAALVDGQPSVKSTKRARIRELRQSLAVSAAALEEIAKRRIALETEAGRAVTAACRPEA